MKTKIVRIICLAVIVCGVYSIITDSVAISKLSEPNNLEPVAEPNAPRKIVMPKGTKMPPRYKCSVHGLIGGVVLNINIEGTDHIYCKKCAMRFVVDMLDLNLPELIYEIL